MKVLVTSGGTKIKIDLVRSITNMSRGTFGAKICDSFLTAMNPHEDEMVFFHAKDSKMPTEYGYGPFEENRWIKPVRYVEYDTFDSYREKLTDLLKKEEFDIVVVHKIEKRRYEDYSGHWTDVVDCGNQLAKVVDFHPDNRQCFEVEYIDEPNHTYRVDICRLADFRDLNKKN